MSLERAEYLSRAKNEYLKKEQAGIAKPFLNIAPYIIGKDKTNAFLAMYWNARLIDNGVDSGIEPEKMKRIIRADINRLQVALESGNPQFLIDGINSDPNYDDQVDFRMNLLKIGLESVEERKRAVVGNSIVESLRGAYLDAISMNTERPLPDKLRSYRDKRR